MLNLSTGERREKLLKVVRDNKENLRNHKIGRKILTKITTCFPTPEGESSGKRKGSFYSHGGSKRFSEYVPGSKN